MSALLEQPAAAGSLDGFEVAKVDYEHPEVRALIEAYFKRRGIPPTAHPLGIRWFALVKDNKIACAAGVVKRPDKSLEVTDLYAAPTRDGLRAGYAALQFFKDLVDSGEIPYFVGVTLAQNTTGQRHFERFFNKGPSSYVYIYDGQGRV